VAGQIEELLVVRRLAQVRAGETGRGLTRDDSQKKDEAAAALRAGINTKLDIWTMLRAANLFDKARFGSQRDIPRWTTSSTDKASVDQLRHL